MILPIYAYGQPVLKRKADKILAKDEYLPVLIKNMWETMYNAKGVGLAAPQVGQSLAVFIVDTDQVHEEEGKGIKKVFINPEIITFAGDEGPYEEGCLSIPDLRADIYRPSGVTIKYHDAEMKEWEESFEGIEARVIQHEYDHLLGNLFTEKIGPLKRKRLQKKLDKIKKGLISADYKLKYV